jgi:hypothetical protein
MLVSTRVGALNQAIGDERGGWYALVSVSRNFFYEWHADGGSRGTEKLTCMWVTLYVVKE